MGETDIRGRWVVSDVYCKSCDVGLLRSEVGTLMEFSNQVIRNPLTGDCHASPSYGPFETRDVKSLTRDFELSQQWTGGKEVVMVGAIKCRGIDFMPVIVLAPDVIIYIFEGGTTFLLERQSSR
jgi:hypothetical protein